MKFLSCLQDKFWHMIRVERNRQSKSRNVRRKNSCNVEERTHFLFLLVFESGLISCARFVDYGVKRVVVNINLNHHHRFKASRRGSPQNTLRRLQGKIHKDQSSYPNSE